MDRVLFNYSQDTGFVAWTRIITSQASLLAPVGMRSRNHYCPSPDWKGEEKK